MWYLWEASNGKFCITCEMLEMDPWTMVTLKLGRDFVCGRCMKQADRFMNSMAELNKEVETV